MDGFAGMTVGALLKTVACPVCERQVPVECGDVTGFTLGELIAEATTAAGNQCLTALGIPHEPVKRPRPGETAAALERYEATVAAWQSNLRNLIPRHPDGAVSDEVQPGWYTAYYVDAPDWRAIMGCNTHTCAPPAAQRDTPEGARWYCPNCFTDWRWTWGSAGPPRQRRLFRLAWWPAPDPPDHRVPQLDWTVEADGWRLVIEDGAIRGLVRSVIEVKVQPNWWPPFLGQTC